MVNVSTAYLPATVAEFPKVRRHFSFLWVMTALLLLDVILLFWIFNPAPKKATHAITTHTAFAGQMHIAETAKPSPVGPVVQRSHKRTRVASELAQAHGREY